MSSKTISVPPAKIPNLEKFLSGCGKAVCVAIQRNGYNFDHCDDLTNDRKCYVLNGPGGTPAEDAERSYRAILFFASRNERFWLSSLIEVEFKDRINRLAKIGLVIFRGDPLDTRKTPLLRAEWDIPGVIEGCEKHAQPHWHIYQSGVDIDDRQTEEFSEITFTEPNASLKYESKWDEAKKFHFAMASKWIEVSRFSHQELVEIDAIPKWIERCLVYIHGQLEFLYR